MNRRQEAAGRSEPSARYAGCTALVVGSTGFLGVNLVNSLMANGARVRALHRGTEDGALAPTYGDRKAETIRGDLGDPTVACDAVRGCDVIFNLSGRSGATASNSDPLADLQENARANLVLLEACRRFNPHVKLIFPSSRLVYKPTTRLPVRETAPVEPLSIYAIHKLAIERYHMLYSRAHGLRTTVFRMTNPYGPHPMMSAPDYSVVNWFLDRAMSNQTLPVYGTGSQLRDYIYVDDVTEALMLAGLDERSDGQVFNLGSGQPTSFRDMAETIRDCIGAGRLEFIDWPQDAAAVETGDFIANISKIRRTLGWAPQVAFEDGVRRAADSIVGTMPKGAGIPVADRPMPTT
jgi:nucleoside-diphosphate-sugar epimerase